MSPMARIVHALPNRTRLRVPSRRGNSSYFTAVVGRLNTFSGVIEVTAEVRTASILLRHSVPFAEIAVQAEEDELFVARTLVEAPDRVSQQVAETLAWLDGQLLQLSGGKFDVRSTLLLGLLILGVIQIARGEIMAPALTLLWYAVQLLTIGDAGSG
jgi:hypothetical protein